MWFLKNIGVSSGLALMLTGCMTNTHVQPLQKIQLEENPLFCVEKNPKVRIASFQDNIVNAFAKQKMRAKAIAANEFENSQCNFRVAYTALRSWGFGIYVSEIEIHVWDRNERLIANAEWKQNNSLSPNRFKSNQENLDDLIASLFKP